MPATLPLPATIETVHPADSTILVLANPATFSADTLLVIRMATEPQGNDADTFRGWLREKVLREIGRRDANDDGTDGAMLEVEAWALPWHTFTDMEISRALCATFSWLQMGLPADTMNALIEIHRSVVAAAATRLKELDTAIRTAQRRKG